MQYTLGFIGCGNMGGALAKAAASAVGGEHIALCDHNEEKTSALAKQTGAQSVHALQLVENAHFIVLGVKPQTMQTAIAEIRERLLTRNDFVLITMAAGISIEGLRAYVGKDVPVIRMMPNTPSQIGQGVILYDCKDVSQADEALFLQAFSKAGVLDRLEESLIDAAAGVSGSGPAFVYAFAQSLAQGAIKLGVPKEKAEKYAAYTLRGAADMLLTFQDAESLKRAVCSPGGTTLAGLAAMEENCFSLAVESGVEAAYKRTLELKK